MDEEKRPLMPNNNMVLAILTTICCCLPLGIVAIIKANSVNTLYAAKQYDAAIQAANDAKKWSLIGIIIGVVVYVVYLLFFGGLAALGISAGSGGGLLELFES